MAKAEDLEFWIEQLKRLDPGWPEWNDLRTFVENASWRTGEVYWGHAVETMLGWHDDKFLTREPRRSVSELANAEEWFFRTSGFDGWLAALVGLNCDENSAGGMAPFWDAQDAKGFKPRRATPAALFAFDESASSDVEWPSADLWHVGENLFGQPVFQDIHGLISAWSLTTSTLEVIGRAEDWHRFCLHFTLDGSGWTNHYFSSETMASFALQAPPETLTD